MILIGIIHLMRKFLAPFNPPERKVLNPLDSKWLPILVSFILDDKALYLTELRHYQKYTNCDIVIEKSARDLNPE